jgi:hypothetical protein
MVRGASVCRECTGWAKAERDELLAALDRLCRAVRVGEAHGFPQELHGVIVDECIHAEEAITKTRGGT